MDGGQRHPDRPGAGDPGAHRSCSWSGRRSSAPGSSRSSRAISTGRSCSGCSGPAGHWLCAGVPADRTAEAAASAGSAHVLYLTEGARRPPSPPLCLSDSSGPPAACWSPPSTGRAGGTPVTRLFDRDSIRGIAEDLFSDRKNGNRAVAVLQVHGLPQPSHGTDGADRAAALRHRRGPGADSGRQLCPGAAQPRPDRDRISLRDGERGPPPLPGGGGGLCAADAGRGAGRRCAALYRGACSWCRPRRRFTATCSPRRCGVCDFWWNAAAGHGGLRPGGRGLGTGRSCPARTGRTACP